MKANPEAELAAKLALIRFDGSKNAYQIAGDAGLLKSLARAHNRLAEAECNREITSREIRRRQSIQAKIIEILKPYIGDGRVRFSGDPRGYTVKVQFPDGRGNTWGGDEEGWGI